MVLAQGYFFIHKSLSGIAFNSPNEIDLGNILISDKISFFETIIAYETRNSNSLKTKIKDMYAIGSNNDTQMLQRNKKVKYAVYIGGACNPFGACTSISATFILASKILTNLNIFLISK